ncbi:hypothetical protein GCM10008937_22740 [Deinococcus depolymerans]|uniref:Uncharacterized protein n=1 Tax=Deinococcus depolymerans TaxID=392408 RepID=A0ABN1C9F1_9DEIO
MWGAAVSGAARQGGSGQWLGNKKNAPLTRRRGAKHDNCFGTRHAPSAGTNQIRFLGLNTTFSQPPATRGPGTPGDCPECTPPLPDVKGPAQPRVDVPQVFVTGRTFTPEG